MIGYGTQSLTIAPTYTGCVCPNRPVLACAAMCFGLPGVFLPFANASWSLFNSLSDDAYGIYLVHYVVVIWLHIFCSERREQERVFGARLPCPGLIANGGVRRA